jgi:hypothetical protein
MWVEKVVGEEGAWGASDWGRRGLETALIRKSRRKSAVVSVWMSW